MNKYKHPRDRFKPSTRIYNALKWISRDKWLSPSEIHRICHALVENIHHGNPSAIIRYAYPNVCDVAGMIGGEPPFWMGTKEYPRWLSALRNMRKLDLPELAILKIQIRSNL